MQTYLVKNADGKVTKMQSKVDPSTLPLPEGTVVLGLESEFEIPEARDLKEVNGEIVEDLDAVREKKLARIRELRAPLIAEADILLNIAQDNSSGGITALRAYRQSLRDATEEFKDDMTLLDEVDPETYVFPAKP